MYASIALWRSVVCEWRVEIYTNGLALTKEFVDFLSLFDNNFFIYLTFHRYDYKGNREDRYLQVCRELKKIIRCQKRELTIKGAIPLCEPISGCVEFFNSKGCKYTVVIHEIKRKK